MNLQQNETHQIELGSRACRGNFEMDLPPYLYLSRVKKETNCLLETMLDCLMSFLPLSIVVDANLWVDVRV